ncbi:NADH-quinone oxidoreductase subunit NuoK [Caldiplasma sukawensis]
MYQFFVQLVALAIFSIGLYGIMVSKLGIKMLISVELLLNGAILSLVSTAIGTGSTSPLIMGLFTIAIAAVESATGISILVAIYRRYGKIDISLLQSIRW